LRAPVYGITVTNPGPQTSVVGHPVTLQVQGSDSGGSALAYSASGLPAGLSINGSTGFISGTPTSPGGSTVTIGAADGFANSGSTQFSWTVTQPASSGPAPATPSSTPPRHPTVSGASLAGVSNRNAKLKFTINAGANAPAVSGATVSLPSGLSFGKVSKKALARDVAVSGVKFNVRLAGGRLRITFAHAMRHASVTVSSALLRVSGALAGKVRRHSVKRLMISVKAVDASGLATTILVSLKV
jgi:hypothetical protein